MDQKDRSKLYQSLQFILSHARSALDALDALEDISDSDPDSSPRKADESKPSTPNYQFKWKIKWKRFGSLNRYWILSISDEKTSWQCAKLHKQDNFGVFHSLKERLFHVLI